MILNLFGHDETGAEVNILGFANERDEVYTDDGQLLTGEFSIFCGDAHISYRGEPIVYDGHTVIISRAFR